MEGSEGVTGFWADEPPFSSQVMCAPPFLTHPETVGACTWYSCAGLWHIFKMARVTAHTNKKSLAASLLSTDMTRAGPLSSLYPALNRFLTIPCLVFMLC